MSNKYIVQSRRGTKEQWQDYEQLSYHVKPFAGELVVEYDNGIPRIKIGDGEHEFSELNYMSTDNFLLPKIASITLYGGNSWIQDTDSQDDPIANRYHQVVTFTNGTITSHSKIDLQPSPEQLHTFHEKDITFTTVNEDGVVTVYVVGEKPQDDYTIQATIMEVILDE